MAYTRGDWTEAERSCRQILALQEDNFEALNLLGIIAAQTRRMDEAAYLFGRAVAVNPAEPTAHNNFGNVLKHLERFDEALASYDEALNSAPTIEADNGGGVTLHELNRFADALDSYRRALTLRPDYAEAHINRGVTLQVLKRFDEALDSYARALRVRPDYAEAYLNHGNTLRELNDSTRRWTATLAR